MTEKPKKKLGRPPEYDRVAVMAHVCEQLTLGRSLLNICTTDPGMPSPMAIRLWILEDKPKGIRADYMAARVAGYSIIAEDIVDMADKTHEWVMVQKTDRQGNLMYNGDIPILEKRLMPLSSDMVAHKRLQVDTRKWYLSKVLPKIYGDKIQQELTGADGGPIAIAGVDLKALSDEELKQMQALIAKAAKKK